VLVIVVVLAHAGTSSLGWRQSYPRPLGLASSRLHGIVPAMRYEFLSDEWFTKVDELVASAGDLQIPEAMKAVEVNVTIVSPSGETPLFMKDGLFTRGHQAGVGTTLTLSSEIARRIFVDGDTSAGVQAFLAGQIKVEGDLAKVVAMQTTMPSEPQQRLTKRIAEITA
jgi:hypothetical protein